MPFEDHEAFNFSDHLGLFDRGEPDSVPADHFVTALNIEFGHKSWNTRHGFDSFQLLINAVQPILRVQLYQRTNEAPRYLYLDSAGNLFDSTNPAPIITVPGEVDFSAISLFNRAYITFHNRQVGSATNSVYMYDGTTARLAAGLAPVAPTFAVVTDAVGKISKGIHLFSVAYETDTGFITKPGPVVVYKAPGKKAVNISNIPIGPAGTVARHILVTKFLNGFNGNPADYELFFLQKINNNTTTFLNNVTFIDSSLVNSADYLLDLLETIPAFVAMAEYQGSLVGVGENGKESLFRVSLAGQPESFNAVDGFGICYPGEGQGLRNVKEYRGNLYLFKQYRTFSTRANGDSPSTWTTILIDAAVGCGCFGLSQIRDSTGDSRDNLLVYSSSGLMQFYGRYTDKPLSWKIENTWLANVNLEKGQICIDPDLKRVYIIDGAGPNMLVGDLSNGLSPDDVRWSIWQFNRTDPNIDPGENFTDIIFSQDGFLMYQGHNFGDPALFRLDQTLTHDDTGAETSPNQAIGTIVQFPFVSNPDAAVAHHNAFRAQIRGVGTLRPYIISTDGALAIQENNLGVVPTPGKDYVARLNMVTERASFKFIQYDQPNLGFIQACMECSHFAQIMWETRPS